MHTARAGETKGTTARQAGPADSGTGGYGPRDITPPRLSGVSVAGANVTSAGGGGASGGGNWIRSNSGLKSLTLTFSEAVTLPGAGSAGSPAIRAFIGGANPAPITLTTTPGATADTLIVTLDSAIHTGLVTLIAEYSIVDAAGNNLDGEVVNPEALSLPSGDSLPGGQSVLRFKVLSGDVNRDGIVDGNDLGLVLNGFDTYSADADLDGNGVVDSEDVNAVVSNFDATLAKDDGARPSVTSITPDPTKNLIADIGSVSVSFNEPVNLSMISPRGLFLVNDASASQGGGGGSGSTPIPASGVALSADGKTATFTFSSPVAFCGAYRIGLSQALADTSGSLAVAPTSTSLSGFIPPADPFITATPVVTGTEFFTFTGTAERAAKVRVTSPAGSIEAPVAADGKFTAQIQLPADVLATIYFTAVSPCNIASSPSSRRISFDASAPNVFIDFPAAGAALTVDKTNVMGRVGDEFSGFAGITVTVNGTPAQVNVGGGNNGTFIATDVPVNASGSTTFTVVATDIVGNQRTTSINVTKSVIKPTDYTIIPISGDGQTGGVKSVLANPLVVKLSKPDGSPLPGKVVTFDITRSDGQLLAAANGTPGASGPLKLQVFTDASGLARAYWRLGSDAGSGNNRVNVTSQDLVGTVSFSASGIASAAGRIVVGDHDYQKAQAGAQLPQPLRIFVTDGDTGNGVKDVPVTFTVTQGDGLLGNGEESITLLTDPTGHIDATFFLGVTPGINTVEATFPGNPGLPATFTATGLERNDADFTTLEGIVQDNAGRAIGGAIVTLKTTLQFASGPSLFTLGPKSTDVNGKFAFTKADLPANALDTDLPAGPAKLLADARNPVTLNGVAKPVWSFPYVGYEMVLVKGAVNSLPQPIYLPEMDPRNEVLYDGTKDVVLKVAGIDGLEFKVKAGSMTRENGTRPSPADPEVLRLNQVHFDEVPMPIPDGSAFPFAWTFQPKNARFNPPVQVTLPNLTGLAPGSAATIVQWNNDTASFQAMGTGKVSANGATITTEAGTGITVAGWGGVTPPPPPKKDIKHIALSASVDRNNDGIPDSDTSPTDCSVDPATAANPIEFWVNNDTDHVPGRPDLSGLPDDADQVIETARDLEDFLPISVQLPGDFATLLTQGYSIRYSTSGVTLSVYKAAAPGDQLIRNVSDAKRQINDTYAIAGGGEHRYNQALVSRNLSSELTAADLAQGRLDLLLEFNSTGFGGITFYITGPDGTTVEGSCTSVPLRIYDVREMYERAYATPSQLASPRVIKQSQLPAFGYDIDHTTPYARGSRESQDTVVFVHGWNVEDPGWLDISATTFKRLWLSGFRGRFCSFRWPSLGTFAYNESEYRAFKYGESLRQYLDTIRQIRGTPDVCAHSQGNVVVCEALRLGAQVKTFVMMQAALSAGALSDQAAFPDQCLLNSDVGTPTQDQDIPSSAITAGYRGYYAGIKKQAAKIVDFYNPTDFGMFVYRANQVLFKPDIGDAPQTGYRYTGSGFILRNNQFNQEREVADRHEAMAFCSRSLTHPIGSEGIARTMFTGYRNLHTEDGFGGTDLAGLGDKSPCSFSAQFILELLGSAANKSQAASEHGAEFDRDIQNLPKFHNALLDAFGISPATPNAPTPGPGNPPPSQRLDSSWTLTVAGSGQNTQPDASGSFTLAGVSADGRFVRILGYGTQSGARVYMSSDYLDLVPPAGQIILPSSKLAVSATPPSSPVSLTVTPASSVIAPGASVQLVTTALFPGGTSGDVTTRAKGTNYASTNPAVATVTQDGLVRALADGTVFITISNEGATFVKRLDVAASTFTTTVTGVAMLPSGTPAAGASISTLPFGGSATAGANGGFSISPVVPVGTTNITASASLTVANKTYSGLSALLAITPGGITDAGLLKMVAPYDGPLFPKPSYTTGSLPDCVAIADLDGDGHPDLVVANYNGGIVSVLRNNGDGTFAERVDFAAGNVPYSVAIGDLNGDGRPDIAVANWGSSSVSVLRNTSTGSGKVSFAATVDYAAGNNPRSVSIGDLDGDGRADLAVANNDSSTVSLLRNLGNGTFAAKVDYATGANPRSVAISDNDGDGRPDLVVANYNSRTVSVLRNNGNGTFAAKVDYATGSGSTSVVSGDLDGDGRPDLAVANANSNTVSVLRNLGSGTFAPRVDYTTGSQPTSVAIGDLDGDGKPDLVVGNSNGSTMSVFKNNGNSSFPARVDYAISSNYICVASVAIADLDGDRSPDLVVTNGLGDTVSVFRNNANGTFVANVDYATGPNASSVAIGDLDADGRPDLAVANHSSNTVSVLRNLGSGTFAPRVDFPTGVGPISVAIGDLDGDGKSDLAVANYNGNTISVLRNNGNGIFASKVDYPTGNTPHAVAIGDLNGDGNPDLVVANYTGWNVAGTVSVLRNFGNGTFGAKVDYATGKSPTWVAIGDVNGDGGADLVVANDYSNTVSVLRNLGNGSFDAKVDYSTGGGSVFVAIGDLDGDSKPDLVIPHSYGSDTVSILRNNGDGTFAAKIDYATGIYPYSVAIGDLDGDGTSDLAVTNQSSNTVGVLLNTGNGTFATHIGFATGYQPCSVAIGDLDGDGRPDLAIASYNNHNINGTVSVLRNQSGGTSSFTAPLNRFVATHKTSAPPLLAAANDDGAFGATSASATSNASSNTSTSTITTRNAAGLTSANATTNGKASAGTTEGANSGANANAANTNSGTDTDTRAIPLGTTTTLGTLGGKQSYVNASAADGSVAVGWSETADGWRAPFIWTPRTGMRPLADLTHPRDLMLLPFGSSEAVALEGPDGMNAGGDPAAAPGNPGTPGSSPATSLPTMRVCVRVSRPGVECAPAPMVRVRLGVDSRADVNGDGMVDSADLDLIRKHGRAYSIGLDVNLDGRIDNEDLKAVRERVGK